MAVVEVAHKTTTVEEVSRDETVDSSTSVSTVQLPPLAQVAGQFVAGVAGTALKAAEGGTPWGLISGLVTTAMTGWYAAHQKAKADQEKQKADLHRADSDEAWAKLEAALRKAPPESGA
jgi:hypothetical protein